jgi:RNA polymerase sigma-70 factor (ECF subfamily)
VYDDHVRSVYGFFSYRLGSRDLAEDLTQATFERAARSFARYDPRRGNHLTWLLAIARNLLIDHFREQHGEPMLSLDEVDLESRAALETLVEDRCFELDPELRAALALLGDREREIVGLRYGADMPGPEIAQLTGLTLANVQQILSRSLRRLRSVMEERRLSAGAGGAREDQHR